ncbi:MAG TPA: hypothetical protein VGE83_00280 [Terracidiphilus sp.]|jgi:hypothetical protein
MKLRNVLLSGALVLGLIASGVTIAQDVNPNRFPNLNAAQLLIDQALAKVATAQQTNECDVGGHAARAHELLAQANHEITLAGRAAERH